MKQSTTVPLRWDEVYFTNCPMVSTNNVDHVVIGARADSVRRSILGSVSAEVAAKADCSVTVVRFRSW